MNLFFKAIAAVLIIGAFAFAGDADYQNEVEQARIYAHNVCSGYHPDYDQKNPDCQKTP